MATSYVLDASALALQIIEQPNAAGFLDWYLPRLRKGVRFLAPSIALYELTNVLHRTACRDHRGDREFARAAVRDAMQGIEIDETAWASTWRWCGDLSGYDASYLGLAEGRDATLVTYDRKLAKIAAEHVPVIGVDGLD